MKKLIYIALLLGAFFPAPALARPPMCRKKAPDNFKGWMWVPVPCSKPRPNPTTKPLRCEIKGRYGTVYVPCVPMPKPKKAGHFVGNGAIDGNGIANRVNNGLYTDEVWNNLK